MRTMEEIMKRLNMEFGSKEMTDEERIEHSRKSCQRKCDFANSIVGNLDDIDGIKCERCKNKGYFLVPELCGTFYSEKQVVCECAKQRKQIMMLIRSGLQSVIEDCTFDKYKATEAWQKSVLNTAKKYVEETETGENWFYFGGATGAGKTMICSAIAIELLRRGREIKYMLWQDESKRLKAHINESDYDSMISVYKDVEILYIDDFFKVARSEYQNARPSQGDINLAFEIINSRYTQKKITIISSECTLSDLLDIDEATAGRIKQKCGEYCLSIKPDRNKNYRLK